ncbi:conserved protein of unknown function [Pseudodesulfovibrio profundus]|uniref:Uncharacterized protein n=1 Tax=Pseudodesulfovibrio profundus TaxID=57320 RepID=A0A2C8FF11_9BACT|nr:conserved protein of unknown function [Pseudodesulfovibrio profundus]
MAASQKTRKGAAEITAAPKIALVPPVRFEHTAPGLGILCSIHLSYGGNL